MKRVGASLVLICALSSSAFAETPAAPTSSESTTTPTSSLNNPNARQKAAQSSIFSALVAQGDRERRAGRAPEAAQAYAQALKIEWSPLIGGRLGVLLVELGQPTKAADILLDAIADAADASPLERYGFLKAYDKAISEVCRVDIDISEAHTMLLIDGEEKFPNALTGFTLFLKPGDHELRAKLEGFQDAVYQFNASKAGRIRVPLVLVPIPSINPPKLPDALLRRHRLARREAEDVVKSLEEPPEDEPEKRVVYGGVDGGIRPEKTRIEVAAGPLIVFGVASWQPAVGAVVGVRWKPKNYFSLGAEGRAAWLTSGVKGEPINAMTAGGIASACWHYRWFFGCALGHLGVINVDWEATSYKAKSDSFVKAGVGGRIGASFVVSHGFVLGASFDFLATNARTTIVVGQTLVVNQPALLLGSQLSGGWEF